jgi:RimJ/RimL family protein N-acetyltransferase
MPIVTPRLILAPPAVSYAKDLTTAIDETWDSLAQFGFMKDRTSTADQEYLRQSMATAERQFAAREEFIMIGKTRETDELALVAGLGNIDWSIGKFTVHYWVRRKFQGTGFATECVHALLIYARDVLGAKSVGLGFADENIASRRVAEKLGFDWLKTDREGVTLPNGDISPAQVHVRWNLDTVPAMPVSWG